MVNVVGARHSIVEGFILHNQTASIILYFFLCIYNKVEENTTLSAQLKQPIEK